MERVVHSEAFGEKISVSEFFDEAGSGIRITRAGRERALSKYAWKDMEGQLRAPERQYLGLSPLEIRASGRDLMAEKLLGGGAPEDCAALKGILPRLTDRAYGFVAPQASWNGIIITGSGGLVPQLPRGGASDTEIFSPTLVDPELGASAPAMTWLDGSLPIAVLLFRGAGRILELCYVCEAGDTGRDPCVWIRALTLSAGAEKVLDERFFVCGRQQDRLLCATDHGDFWDVFADAALHWLDFRDGFSGLACPDEALLRGTYGCCAAAAVTFTDVMPHYGHMGYGWDIHDNFPPTFLTVIEGFAALGNAAFAGRLADYVLRSVVDARGRFSYRQGGRRLFGASASEYGQFLWLLERCEGALAPALDLDRGGHLDTLARIGGLLIDARAPSEACPDLRLIRMCAEADTNGRVYSYAQNGFWAARGLDALAEIMARHGRDGEAYRAQAREILADTKEAVGRLRADSPCGPLPPFQMEYTPRPQTLSDCRTTDTPMDDAAWTEYLRLSDVRERIPGKQDYLENTYANYRYYPEMLASRCLEICEEDAIVALRETLGGEMLGMTRFLNRIDDWPVFNYARFLLETDRLDKYLLLLFAHTNYHGLPEMMSYFEQVGMEGRVYAPDCTPCAMITPLMTAWMLAFEPVGERALYLLRGVPGLWFRKGFSARRLGTRWGEVSVSAVRESGALTVEAALPEALDAPAYLDVRGAGGLSVVQGGECVLSVTELGRDGIRIRLARGGRIRLSIVDSDR